MNTALSKKYRLSAAAMAACFLLMSALLPPWAAARDFRRGNSRRAFYPPPGYGFKVLPRGHRPVHVGLLTYFFLEGVFYRHAHDGYVVTAAPVGAVVPMLPAAAMLVTIGAVRYYTYADVYYQKIPEGYLVVKRPVEPVPPDAAVAWEGDRVRVNVPILNVRSGPGTEHPIVKEVHQGDLLEVRSSSSEWYYVKLPDNSFGWVMVKYTALVKPRGVG